MRELVQKLGRRARQYALELLGGKDADIYQMPDHLYGIFRGKSAKSGHLESLHWSAVEAHKTLEGYPPYKQKDRVVELLMVNP